MPQKKPNSKTDHHDYSLHKELAQARHKARKDKLDNYIDTTPGEPTWLSSLNETSAENPHVKKLLTKLTELLNRLPTIASTNNKAALDNYFTQVVEEITRVYCAIMTMVEMNENLSDKEKDQELNRLVQERNEAFFQVATLLGNYETE